MGEVGAAIPEKQTESPSVNGEVNGVCKPTEDETEQMDVDTEDSQISSSENGISQNSEEASTKEILISKAESVTEESKVKESDDSKDASRDKLSDNIAADENTNDDDDEDDVDDDEEDTETPAENKDEIKENGLPESPGSVEKPDEEEDEDEDEEVETAVENKTAEVSENGPESTESAGPKKPHENSEKKSDETEKVVDKEEEKQKVDDKTEEKTSTIQNGKVDETPAETKNQSADEIELISDEEQDPIPEDPTDHIVHNTTNDSSSDIPQLKISKVQENVEQMEVDSTTNGNSGGCDTTSSRSKAIDDDGAVVIQSDSESEVDSPSKNKTQQDDDVHEILSDKDDCVVIEDDDKKDKEDTQVRRTNRQRKSVVKVRDFSAFGDDDDDDDIEEIVDDDQPPSKRLKSSASNSPSTPSNMMPQVGQITIKDARSLMGTSYIDGTPKGTFQQQFIQATGGNQSPLQNLSKQNSPFTVIPGGSPGQGVFVGNVRPTLAPLTSTPQPKLAPITPTLNQSPLSLTNPTLLPALTDDMFVLEAPSFIVPYIYEKPPSENLKEIVSKIGDELEKLKMETSSGGDKSEDHKANADSTSDAAKNDEAGASTSAEKSAETSKKKSSRRKGKNPDDSWDESDTSTDEEASDSESRTKVLIKEAKEDLDSLKAHILTPEVVKGTTIQASPDIEKKADNYFESPLGKFFVDIGINLVQEFVQADLLRQQKRKQERAKMPTAEIELAIKSLKSNLETSKKRNEPFKFEMKRCEYCNFKSESALSMAHHYETPHMRNYAYKCNFCPFETRPPHDILFHMEAVHNIKGRLEKAPSYHQCPNCPFEDNGKSKLARHAPVCLKKFRPEGNLLPPHDWEAPAKIPRIKPRHGLVGTATAYQAMAAQAAAQKAALATIAARNNITPVANNTPPSIRNRGRPQTVTRPAPGGGTMMRNTTPLRPQMPAGVVLPNNYQITAGGQLIQTHNNKKNTGQQPSISITPLPRQPGAAASNTTSIQAATLATAPTKPAGGLKPGQSPTGGKASFVICEICDGYIKDLEQLRNHMQWMHKVKIHPKMIYNRPPLNCQKCQFRFFTDQGLERHLLGSHGLVTSSMQEAANKGRDAGRCPVCGRMYQWKLLNHVSRDHHMTLKPAHLSYKCTVCTATFGMYKQFENHVYTAHSTVAKKAMDSKKSSSNSSGVSISNASLSSGINNSVSISTSNKTSVTALTGGDSLLKPLKINDEITIIPQPATKSRGSASNDYESHVID